MPSTRSRALTSSSTHDRPESTQATAGWRSTPGGAMARRAGQCPNRSAAPAAFRLRAFLLLHFRVVRQFRLADAVEFGELATDLAADFLRFVLGVVLDFHFEE